MDNDGAVKQIPSLHDDSGGAGDDIDGGDDDSDDIDGGGDDSVRGGGGDVGLVEVMGPGLTLIS